MLAAALYVVARQTRSLITGTHPRHSALGIVLLAASLVVLPVLGYLKAAARRTGAELGLRVRRAQRGRAALAVVALASLALERSLGWWQADPVAASLIALFVLREAGVR